ncbi:carbohydrate ABC transporter permease [Solwaraspora sp. WMMD1047]|uniref:carbohydrate ABC transporter permease n=1 Tax=Solwaraspora sp. WMMD1047 TaxID=3016102 RepID=UPI0024160828|nr:carbohydrate ABC transporter permease [Solwaraspora sp. WMMD1047]MDG4834279.1 carbohydrate ABC transporter permease [Solwaraspora sp. WMMD1047]
MTDRQLSARHQYPVTASRSATSRSDVSRSTAGRASVIGDFRTGPYLRGQVARHGRHHHPSGRSGDQFEDGLHRGRTWLANIGATLWLIVVAVPIYFIAITSLRTSEAYVTEGALRLPSALTFENYRQLIDLGFGRFLLNSAIVTVATVAGVLLLAVPAAYSIVRSRSRSVRLAFAVFLFGLAIPAQAVIIPIYLIITRLHLYDALTAIILPTVAFSLPMAIIVLTSHLRDISKDHYEAMIMDGADTVSVFFKLVLPSARPALVTVGIFSGLNAWNGFIFPLVLTQSEDQRVVPLGLWAFQSQYGTDVPGLFAAVLISTVPVLALYLFGRRQLLRGLSAAYSR